MPPLTRPRRIPPVPSGSRLTDSRLVARTLMRCRAGTFRCAREASRSSVRQAIAAGNRSPKRSITEAAMAWPASWVGASRIARAWARTSSAESAGSFERMFAINPDHSCNCI